MNFNFSHFFVISVIKMPCLGTCMKEKSIEGSLLGVGGKVSLAERSSSIWLTGLRVVVHAFCLLVCLIYK